MIREQAAPAERLEPPFNICIYKDDQHWERGSRTVQAVGKGNLGAEEGIIGQIRLRRGPNLWRRFLLYETQSQAFCCILT